MWTLNDASATSREDRARPLEKVKPRASQQRRILTRRSRSYPVGRGEDSTADLPSATAWLESHRLGSGRRAAKKTPPVVLWRAAETGRASVARDEAVAVVAGLGLELVDAQEHHGEALAELVEADDVAGAARVGPYSIVVGTDARAVYATVAEQPELKSVVLPEGAQLLASLLWAERHGTVAGHVVETADAPGARSSAVVGMGLAKAAHHHGWTVVWVDADPSSDTRWSDSGGLRWHQALAAVEDGPAASTLNLLPEFGPARLIAPAPHKLETSEDCPKPTHQDQLRVLVAAFRRAADLVIVDRGPVSPDAAAVGHRTERLLCVTRPMTSYQIAARDQPSSINSDEALGANGLNPGWALLGVHQHGMDSRAEAQRTGLLWAGSLRGPRPVHAASKHARKLWIPRLEAGVGLGIRVGPSKEQERD